MPRLLLDTNALLWLVPRHVNLGPKAHERCVAAFREEAIAVSAFSFLEIGTLRRKRRLTFDDGPLAWRRRVLELGIREVAMTGPIAVAAEMLEDFHGDPADRVIVATARTEDATLLTSDRLIMGWRGELDRQYAVE
jgi:PIN domain nuclease of toxin-antitoxin system